MQKIGPPEVLRPAEVEKPVPKKNEVLIKIFATTVTSSDCIVRDFKIPRWHPVGVMMGLVIGFSKPRNPILGMVLAGEVESVGKNVTFFKEGDRVFGYTDLKFGTYAQYKCLPEKGILTSIPDKVSYEEAVTIPYGGMLALHFLKKGKIQKGEKILINGASGAVGTSAVQLAVHFGAMVTGVCGPTNLEMVKSLGAETVINYKKEDFTERGEQYDLILDAVPMAMADRKGFKLKCKESLTPKGRYISVDDGTPKSHLEDLVFLKELLKSEELKPVIDRSYPLEQMVEAHKYVETGHKKGNIVITVAHH